MNSADSISPTAADVFASSIERWMRVKTHNVDSAAKQLGVSPITLLQYLNCKRQPTPEQVADAFSRM